MARQISRWSAFHALVVALPNKTGKTLPALSDGGVYDGPKLSFEGDAGLVAVERDRAFFHVSSFGVSRLCASSLACIFFARAARFSFSDFFNPKRARFSADFLSFA